ncbi:hypothetical protein MAPG_09394 [Magnaporthiopsis poae ATCC 64411]|uniref:Uncharacterized protein n=1 Tax=Magnaporthiopsis poae (strain ATCC 64411 / 73-15) TaxID=644358 RepID=A0A0C4E9U4_MAGP6|nr:hypothetical protein MAPG_09394 [Magnaporthiopsis poae ATCC 64411]
MTHLPHALLTHHPSLLPPPPPPHSAVAQPQQTLLHRCRRRQRLQPGLSTSPARSHHLRGPGRRRRSRFAMNHRNVDDITRFVDCRLEAPWPCRGATVQRIVRKSGGVFLWAELVVGIINAAISEGASRTLVDNTVLEMPGDLDGLYEWMLSTLKPSEKAQSLALFQWTMLASEPMRLNDLRTAMAVTKPLTLDDSLPRSALSVDPPTTLTDLHRRKGIDDGRDDGEEDRHGAGGLEGFDSAWNFYRDVRAFSLGLLKARPDTDAEGKPRPEPLGLQRVYAIHESVVSFFLSGRGFAALDKGSDLTPYSLSFSSLDLRDTSHYVLLHACLAYLNLADFACLEKKHLGRNGVHDRHIYLPLAPMPRQETIYWRKNVLDQRRLIISSYPFLRYAVDNLIFHMLSPRAFRYYLPQSDVLRLFAANDCRLWRRWTALLGVPISDPIAALEICAAGPAHELLDPVYGARYRLERIFRRVSKIALEFHEPVDTAVASPVAEVKRRMVPPTKATAKSNVPETTNRTVLAVPEIARRSSPVIPIALTIVNTSQTPTIDGAPADVGSPTASAFAMASAAAAKLRRTRRLKDKQRPPVIPTPREHTPISWPQTRPGTWRPEATETPETEEDVGIALTAPIALPAPAAAVQMERLVEENKKEEEEKKEEERKAPGQRSEYKEQQETEEEQEGEEDEVLVPPLSPLSTSSVMSPQNLSLVSTAEPSLFSPVSVFSPALRNTIFAGEDGGVRPVSSVSVNTLLSPLSALEATFETDAFALPKRPKGRPAFF